MAQKKIVLCFFLNIDQDSNVLNINMKKNIKCCGSKTPQHLYFFFNAALPHCHVLNCRGQSTNPNYPGVYSRVAAARDWIRMHTNI